MEKILDVIPDFLNVLLPVVTLWAGWATGRIREKKKKEALAETEEKALREGVKSLLRGQIIDLGLHYIREGEIPPYGLDNLENYYTAYVDLGDGDRSTHDIMERCRRLHIRSGYDDE